MNPINISPAQLQTIYSAIGLSNKDGRPYKLRENKHRQVFDFLVHIEKAVKSLSTKRTLSLVDCACGKSYLSFITNYYLQNKLNIKADFTCIDINRHVIEQSKNAAKSLGLDNMHFICDDIFQIKPAVAPDIIYSLHACDTATDMTIAKGIAEQAKFILTVSCCQHTIRANIKKHPLVAATRHSVYKERVADMLSDTMRSLILEEAGYQISLFEFVPTQQTPKNVMLRAVKSAYNDSRARQAREMYDALKKTFNTEPMLREYLNAQKRRFYAC